MTKLLGFVGATAGGWVGWSIGAPAGMFTGFLASVVGMSAGLYAGRRFAGYLGS